MCFYRDTELKDVEFTFAQDRSTAAQKIIPEGIRVFSALFPWSWRDHASV